MARLVAWAPIKSGKNNGTDKEPDMQTISVNPGESVSQDALGVDDDGWKQLVESGAVRTMAYPDMPETYQNSPVEYLRDQVKAAAEGSLADVQASTENVEAILAANAAATGTALATDPAFDEDVANEMDAQKEANSPGSSTEEVTTTTGETTFQRNSNGVLLASDDGGDNWRRATDEERAAYNQ